MVSSTPQLKFSAKVVFYLKGANRKFVLGGNNFCGDAEKLGHV